MKSSGTFEAFWKIWPRKVAKKAAHKAWVSATKRADVQTILSGATFYANERQGKDHTYTLHAASWLNGDRWEDYSAANLPLEQDESEHRKRWRLRLRNYTPTSYWPDTWGARPGQPGFEGPKDLEANALRLHDNVVEFSDYSRDSKRDVA